MPDVSSREPLIPAVPLHIATKAQTGTHARDGVFVAAGPGVRRGAAFDRFHISRVAPTVLRLLGLPVPERMEGGALEEIIEAGEIEAQPRAGVGKAAGAAPAKGAPRALSPREAALIERRLKGLGYL